jgi:hypothetical protein
MKRSIVLILFLLLPVAAHAQTAKYVCPDNPPAFAVHENIALVGTVACPAYAAYYNLLTAEPYHYSPANAHIWAISLVRAQAEVQFRGAMEYFAQHPDASFTNTLKDFFLIVQ